MHWILIAFLYQYWGQHFTPPIAVAVYERQVDCENAIYHLQQKDQSSNYICANEFIGKAADIKQ